MPALGLLPCYSALHCTVSSPLETASSSQLASRTPSLRWTSLRSKSWPGQRQSLAAPRRFSRTVVAEAGTPKLAKAVRPEVEQAIANALGNCVTSTNLNETVKGLGPKKEGKVRDQYDAGDKLVVVTTDRQSAFDRLLAAVPFKGQVLNQTSAWWFRKTRQIVPNAFLAAPDPNVTIFKKCTVFPVEFVVRGYVTGTTSTSLWTVYRNGLRNYCGNELPEGLAKNDRLARNIVTPTTKAEDHDEPVTPDQIVERGLMTREEYDYTANKALSLFAFGQGQAAAHGLLLVDTKYEFGKTPDGTIHLIDEVHTPDSSRYWLASTYQARHKEGLEPENIDKEFLRLWFKEHCDPYNDAELPEAPEDLVAELSRRYIVLYETITGQKFNLPRLEEPISERMARNVADYLSKQSCVQD